MRTAVTAAVGGATLLAALAGTLMWGAQSTADDEARAREDARAQVTVGLTDRTTELERELASEKRRTQQAERDATELRKAVEAATAELATATEQLATAEAEPPAGATRNYPAFRPAGLEEALAGIDWEVVATSMSNLPPLIDELAGALAEGRSKSELPPETIGAIQHHNGPILAVAMKLAQSGLAGTEVNSAFTHPGFMSNALAATLDALEMPLTADQRAALERITLDYSTRESQRLAAYDDSTYVIEKSLDESRLKRAYFTEVYSVLTDEQHNTLRPESVRGRTQLDLFGAGPLWTGRAGPVLVSDRDELAAKATRWVTRRGGIADDQQARAEELIGAWVADLPEPFIAWVPDALVNAGMLQVEHVEDSAARVVALLRTLDAELELDVDGRDRLRAVPGTIVVYSRPDSE